MFSLKISENVNQLNYKTLNGNRLLRTYIKNKKIIIKKSKCCSVELKKLKFTFP